MGCDAIAVDPQFQVEVTATGNRRCTFFLPDAVGHFLCDRKCAGVAGTVWRRRVDILAFFDHHASNGPTEAVNGRREALRRNALGFRNLTQYR